MPLEVAGVGGGGGGGGERQEVMEGEGRKRSSRRRGQRGGEKMTHWLMSTSRTQRTNQYLRQALISCSSD